MGQGQGQVMVEVELLGSGPVFILVHFLFKSSFYHGPVYFWSSFILVQFGSGPVLVLVQFLFWSSSCPGSG